MLTTTKILYNSIVSILENAGIEQAPLEAELLLCWAASADRTALYTRNILNSQSLSKLKTALQQRLRRRPLQYLTGQVEFYGLAFQCRPGVFIPRPETETLVEVALELIKDLKHPSVLDLCTGTGAIGLSIAKLHPGVSLLCSDISPEAIALAIDNAAALSVQDRTAFVVSDLFKNLPGKKFNLIVSNPPYIPSHELQTLAPEIKLYEPGRALDGGPDGMRLYREILKQARRFLVPEGYLVLEIGIGQEPSLKAITQSQGYEHLLTRTDLLGIPRAVVLRPG